MDCDVRKQPNGIQLSYQLPQQALSPAIYPITATDNSTIVLYGHERGLSILKLQQAVKGSASNGHLPESNEEEATLPKLEQWIEVDIKSPVTRVAIPILPSDKSQAPNFLNTNVVALVACADSLLRLITVPLSPNARGKQHEIKITTLQVSCHQELIASLALSWVLSESRPLQDGNKTTGDDDCLYFIIASASVTGAGLLAYHEVSLKSHLAGDEEHHQILAKQFVQAPLLGSTLEFSREARKSSRYPLLLLTSPTCGLVHVMALDDTTLTSKRRRDGDTAAMSGETSPGLSLRIVLSLYAGYHSTQRPVRHKRILDARWIARGTSIAAMFEDGEWGVHYLEILNTKSGGRRSQVKISTSSSFRVLGNLATVVQPSKSTGRPMVNTVAPITPQTRKIRHAALFQNEHSLPNASSPQSRSIGQVTICGNSNGSLGGETLILSYGGLNSYISTTKASSDVDVPGLADSKMFDKRPQSLPLVRLGGERQLCVCTQSTPPSERNSTGLLGVMNTPPDVLIVTDSRLIIYKNHANTKPLLESSELSLPLRSIGSKETSFISRVTSDAVLDVDAMDQVLESMENIEAVDHESHSPTAHTIEMQADGYLHSPSDRAATASKLMIEGHQSRARRKPFG